MYVRWISCTLLLTHGITWLVGHFYAGCKSAGSYEFGDIIHAIAAVAIQSKSQPTSRSTLYLRAITQEDAKFLGDIVDICKEKYCKIIWTQEGSMNFANFMWKRERVVCVGTSVTTQIIAQRQLEQADVHDIMEVTIDTYTEMDATGVQKYLNQFLQPQQQIILIWCRNQKHEEYRNTSQEQVQNWIAYMRDKFPNAKVVLIGDALQATFDDVIHMTEHWRSLTSVKGQLQMFLQLSRCYDIKLQIGVRSGGMDALVLLEVPTIVWEQNVYVPRYRMQPWAKAFRHYSVVSPAWYMNDNGVLVEFCQEESLTRAIDNLSGI